MRSKREAFYSEQHASWAIYLTQGVVAFIDADMIELINQRKWTAMNSNGLRWYASGKDDGKTIYMHRMVITAAIDMFVDHIKHHPIELKIVDNRRSNLRECTRAENLCNMRMRSNKLCAFKGLSWHPFSNSWACKIRKDGKVHSLGYFKDPLKGAFVYDAAAIRLHGEFAATNASLGLLPQSSN